MEKEAREIGRMWYNSICSKQEIQWYIDNGYSIHMTRDKIKFISLNGIKGGSVTIGNNKS